MRLFINSMFEILSNKDICVNNGQAVAQTKKLSLPRKHVPDIDRERESISLDSRSSGNDTYGEMAL